MKTRKAGHGLHGWDGSRQGRSEYEHRVAEVTEVTEGYGEEKRMARSAEQVQR
jgi:hypothetical protein